MKCRTRAPIILLIICGVSDSGFGPRMIATTRGAEPIRPVSAPRAESPFSPKKSAPHEYRNKVNRLVERPLAVADALGRSAVRPSGKETIQGVELRIAWTGPTKFDWNYVVPEIHNGQDLFHTPYPSVPFFLERKLKAKTVVRVSVSDTPYSFYVLDGHPAPFFYDSEKAVIWEITGLDKEFQQMGQISTTSHKIKFTAEGGDIVTYLTVDFSARENAPEIRYWDEGGPP